MGDNGCTEFKPVFKSEESRESGPKPRPLLKVRSKSKLNFFGSGLIAWTGRPLTVLVTGGAGYIGSHVVVQLLVLGHNVVVADCMINCYKDENRSIPESLFRAQILSGKRVHFYPINIMDPHQLDKVFKEHKIDVVMHFAALKAVGESTSKPLEYYTNNVGGSLTLLEVMRENEVFNLVYSSSSTVYGTPQFLPLTEDHPTGVGCTNPYGQSKFFVETILKDVAAADPTWKIISLRYFNPVGAHESGQIGEDPQGIPNNLMPCVAQVAVGRLPILKIYGDDWETEDGTGVRDYIHIEDLAEGHLAALNKLFTYQFSGFKAYNLGTGKGYSVLDVVQAFEKASGRNIPVKVVQRRPGDIAASYCDANLAKQELNWIAGRDLLDMCVDMWRWQISNPNGYKKDPNFDKLKLLTASNPNLKV